MLQSFEHMHDVHASEEYEFQTAGCELPAWDRAAVSKFLALMAGTAHLTWEQAAGGTVRTARSTRGDTETRAGSNGETGRYYVLASLTPGSTHCTGKSRARGGHRAD